MSPSSAPVWNTRPLFGTLASLTKESITCYRLLALTALKECRTSACVSRTRISSTGKPWASLSWPHSSWQEKDAVHYLCCMRGQNMTSVDTHFMGNLWAIILSTPSPGVSTWNCPMFYFYLFIFILPIESIVFHVECLQTWAGKLQLPFLYSCHTSHLQ